ncbi:O-antigen ligase family protein [Rhodococcus cerastii]|uniref:O-antigen ligase family protein n=1 Tax=Rhodococcus cerastii TaxID=908616 RepID=A0ABU4D9C8_9NOCA|nr:O-antigen ligase family protein [Rhodococcus cerastii]MDV6305701.1 O-antigen ligase family protein [Rhodococcus cerastii]
MPDNMRPALPLFAGIAVAFIVVQDALNTAVGVQGAATLALVALAVVMFIKTKATREGSESSNPLHAWPSAFMWAFVVWATAGFITSPTTEGLQHVAVWFLLPAVAALVAMKATTNTITIIYPWWRRAAIAAALIYISLAAINGPGVTAFPYSERGAGWVLVSAMVLLFAKVIFERESLWPLMIVGTAVVLSLSRTPIAIMLGFAAILIIAGRNRSAKNKNPWFARTLLAGSAAIAGVIYLFTSFTSISNRFSQGDGYTLFGVEINASGRDKIWTLTTDLWKENIWFGNGPGAAQRYITDYYDASIAHPHNEYLRFLADTGVVGLALWILGMGGLLFGAVKRLRNSRIAQDRTIHGAAILSLLLILGASTTDNPTITVYQTVIYATVLGLSMSRARVAENTDRPTHVAQLDATR